jgi:hypothetical protein
MQAGDHAASRRTSPKAWLSGYLETAVTPDEIQEMGATMLDQEDTKPPKRRRGRRLNALNVELPAATSRRHFRSAIFLWNLRK